jgi:DNA-binding beta-propeller fold protein YncE/cytochrome c peroxidase
VSELPKAELERVEGQEARGEALLRKRMPFRPYLQGGSVAVDPVRGEVFVADTENGTLAVSDPTGKRVLRVIEVGAAPEQVVVAEDGRAFVTVRNAGELAVIAPGATRVQARASLPGEPFGLALSADGKTVFVSVVRSAEVVALDAATLTEKLRIAVAPEPRGLVATPDGDKLFVAHLIGKSVSVVDLEHRSVRTIALPGASPGHLDKLTGGAGRVPNLTFALAVSPSGHRIYVPHVLEDTGQNVAPEVRSGGYGAGAFEPIVATLTTLDADAEELMGDEHDAQSRAQMGFNLRGLTQPRAAVTDPVRNRLFVAGLGTDDVRVLNTSVEDPGLAAPLPLVRAGTNIGPKGLAVSADGSKLYVHASLKHELVVLDVHDPRGFDRPTPVRLTIGEERLPIAAVHGREIFFSSRDRRVSANGQFACASCHPEGKQDGMTWRLDKGPRQTPVLAGRLVGTAPYNWLGTRGSLKDNMKETMGRLGGSGLPKKDLDDLELYLTQYLDPGPKQAPVRTAMQERGRHLFESDEVGCAHCHTPGTRFTDGKNHDIGTTTGEEIARLLVEQGKPAPAQPQLGPGDLVREGLFQLSTTQLLRMLGGRVVPSEVEVQRAIVLATSTFQPNLFGGNGLDRIGIRRFGVGNVGILSTFDTTTSSVSPKPKKGPPRLRLAYNTPSLEGVGLSAPYFHDGSAHSLRDVLTVGNPGDRMGRTSQLSPADLDALVSYLETL